MTRIRVFRAALRDEFAAREDESDARALRHAGTMIGDWANLHARIMGLFRVICGGELRGSIEGEQ